MAHNTVIDPGSGGDTICDYDLAAGGAYPSSGKVPAGVLFVSPNSSTAPTPVTAANGLYVQPGTSTTWAISAASLPLPSGAATAAKQPALGTAGSASADVLTVQGIASMTPLAVAASQGGTWTVQPGNTANTTPWLVADQAAASGGLSIYSFLSTAAVQAAAIKASAGQVYALHFFNNSGTVCYVRLYNQTSSPSTSDTPVYRALIPANTGGAGFVVAIPPGVAFGTGIGIRVTAAVADADNTALGANAVLGNVFYK